MSQRCHPAILVALAALLAVPAVAQPAAQPAAGTEVDPVGYFLGMAIGGQMRQQGFKKGDFDLQAMVKGLETELAGEEPQLTEEQIQQAAAKVEELLQARAMQQNQASQAAAAANQEKSELFLQENAKKEGVTVLPSGLQYQVVSPGTGASPSASDVVRVHYTGRLINGKVFDSSVQRGEPAEFPVGQVIPGWQEALQKMKVGGKWKLFIPPSLAYGARGTPAPPGQEPAIGPNEALIFDVELLDIVK